MSTVISITAKPTRRWHQFSLRTLIVFTALDSTRLWFANKLQMARHDTKKITDAGLQRLKVLKNLQWLYLGNTGVTDAGVNDLKMVLPQLRVLR